MTKKDELKLESLISRAQDPGPGTDDDEPENP